MKISVSYLVFLVLPIFVMMAFAWERIIVEITGIMDFFGYDIKDFWFLLVGIPYVIAISLSMKSLEVMTRAFKVVLIYTLGVLVLSMIFLLAGMFSDKYETTQMISLLWVSVIGFSLFIGMSKLQHDLWMGRPDEEIAGKMGE